MSVTFIGVTFQSRARGVGQTFDAAELVWETINSRSVDFGTALLVDLAAVDISPHQQPVDVFLVRLVAGKRVVSNVCHSAACDLLFPPPSVRIVEVVDDVAAGEGRFPE